MLVNVYDFDKTIYKRDSGVDFILFSMKKYPFKVLKSILKTIPILIMFLLKKKTFMDVKSKIIYFVNEIDLNKLLKEFWDTHEVYINDFYKEKHEENDVIISANYEFLLIPICKRLNVKNLIATKYDFNEKRLIGTHSKGKEKIKLFYEIYPTYKMNVTYSDAKVDIPLLEEGQSSFVVKNGELKKYYKGYWR